MEEILAIKLPEKVGSALVEYAEQMNTTADMLLTKFAENLTGSGRKGGVQKANAWYEQAEFENSLDKALQRCPVKVVRFTDGTSCAAHGTREEVEKEMKKRSPTKKIAEMA